MGAGSFPAGRGRAGFDPAYLPPAPQVITLPRALEYDPSIRGYTMNADGTFVDLHPVDQQVAFLLFPEQGSVPSENDLGTRLRKRLERCDPAQIPNIALDEVRTALKAPIAAGDVLLVSVTTDATVRGRVITKVIYVNLRLPTLNPLQPLASAVTAIVQG